MNTNSSLTNLFQPKANPMLFNSPALKAMPRGKADDDMDEDVEEENEFEEELLVDDDYEGDDFDKAPDDFNEDADDLDAFDDEDEMDEFSNEDDDDTDW